MQDVDYALMASGAAMGDFSTYQNLRDIPSFTYKRDCYDRPGIVDRRSVIRKKPGYALKLSFYRAVEQGEFDQRDRHYLDGILAMLITMAEKHLMLSCAGKLSVATDYATVLAVRFPNLTAREQEVVALTLTGQTAAEIARRLKVAETTVITHRKRAYHRLGVRGIRELSRL
jgi:DNA-binding CsgD family transcriptional regulator